MRHRTLLRLTVLAMIFSLFLAACGGSSEPTKGDLTVYVGAPLSGFQANGGQTVLGGVRLDPSAFRPVNTLSCSSTFGMRKLVAIRPLREIVGEARLAEDQFHAAVRQVADDAGQFKSRRDRLDRVAESHALHAPRIKNIQALADGG